MLAANAAAMGPRQVFPAQTNRIRCRMGHAGGSCEPVSKQILPRSAQRDALDRLDSLPSDRIHTALHANDRRSVGAAATDRDLATVSHATPDQGAPRLAVESRMARRRGRNTKQLEYGGSGSGALRSSDDPSEAGNPRRRFEGRR